MPESIEELVTRARTAFEHARDRADPDREAWMLDLGLRVGQLGRRGAGDHPAVRALIADTAPRLHELPLPSWMRALGRAVEPMTSEDNEYQYALDLRSHVELWKDLYRDAAPDAVAELATDEIDETLAELSKNYYVAEVPADIPASHVWWHRHDADAR